MAGGRALQDTLSAGAEYRSPLADDAGRADRPALGGMARQADRRGRAVRPGADAQRDDPAPACAGAGTPRGIRASKGRKAAPIARGGAVFENAAEHPPRRPGARRRYRGGARRARLCRRRYRRAARGRRVRAGKGTEPVIDFYYWPTPNGWKVAIMLEECGLEYRTVPVNIGKGDQFKPEFLAISTNNRMPVIVDHDPPAEFGEGPLPVFESAAILIHLAEKTGRFLPAGKRASKEMLEWLFWQVGNLGPMAGQLSHFVNYAQGDHPYSHKRYADQYNRRPGWLDTRQEGRDRSLRAAPIRGLAS